MDGPVAREDLPHTPSPPVGKGLGLVAAIALVIGNMIGSGVFLLPSSLAPYGWNAVLAWIAVIAGSLVLAWVLAKLTRALPEADGPFAFVMAAYGRTASFLIAWIYLVSMWAAIVSIALAAVSYLSSLVPAIGAADYGGVVTALALTWAVTLVNLRGVHSAGNFQILTVALKVMPLLLVIGLAAYVLGGGEGEVRPLVTSELGPASVAGAASLTLFAMLGFECASLAAGQVRDPERTIPRATMWGTALTGLLYLLVCSVIALMLPEPVATASPAPFATFVESFLGGGWGTMVALFAIISCVGALNGWILLLGEMPRNLAEQGLLPAWFGVTGEDKTPRRAILVSAVIGSALLLVNASEDTQGMFETLMLLSTSASLWFYLACALAAWTLRVARSWAAIGAGFSIWTLWGAGIEASGWSLVLMLSGLPVWWWTLRSKRMEAAWQAN